MFINNHSLEHITIKDKNKLIWDILNKICQEYWNKIKKVQHELTSIKKIMEKRRRTRTKNKSNNNEKKSGAEKAEYQLFLDVRQFMQQIQGYVNGLQRDEKDQKDQKDKPSLDIKYKTNNLLCWDNFDNFVQQFQ